MKTKDNLDTNIFPTWCPGCGNLGIWSAIKKSINNLDIAKERVVIVYGIGCSGNMASFVKAYGFHGVHGRGIPVAEGIKLANHKLKVIVVGGDGDLLGEGLNHFVQASRANHDVSVIIHNNQIYGLTTGQSSPTSLKKTKSKSYPLGVTDEPINPLQLALTAGATHVSRGFSGDINQLTELVGSSIDHEGFSVLDVLQPCVTFNKINTYKWFQERVEKLNGPIEDRIDALKKAVWTNEKIFTGEFYKEENSPFHARWPQIDERTLIQQTTNNDINQIMESLS